MNDTQARDAADREGLTLEACAESPTGYKGVYHSGTRSRRAATAKFCCKLGAYSSAGGAALALARARRDLNPNSQGPPRTPDRPRRDAPWMTLPYEIWLSCIIMPNLPPRDLCNIWSACSQMRQLCDENACMLWRTVLTRHLTFNRESRDASLLDAVKYRTLVERLCVGDGTARPLEAQGLAQGTTDATAGEQRAWWRCKAVGFGLRTHLLGEDIVLGVCVRCAPLGLSARHFICCSVSFALCRVPRVQFHGYTQEEDLEWRRLDTLRPALLAQSRQARQWRLLPKHVGESVEISWAVNGHPAALWEATIEEVGETRSKQGQHYVRVHYLDFDDAWDEWLYNTAQRLMPCRNAESFAPITVTL